MALAQESGIAPKGGPDGQNYLRGPGEFIVYLTENAEEILDEWVQEAARLGPNYRKRSLAELQDTITQSLVANIGSMAQGSLAPLDHFVEYITALRLEAGFGLSEVQKAFDLFRILVTERLCQGPSPPWLGGALSAMNVCVSYQIHRFSDKFQAMHQAAMERHARELTRKVDQRGRELEESRLRYKTLVEEINDGYFAVVKGRVAFANQAFCKMHKARPNQVLSQLFARFVGESDRERVARAYREVMAGRAVPRFLEYHRLSMDGGLNPTEIRGKVVDLGKGPMLIGICRDITERAAMEQKVRDNERMAYVGELAASLSHEIRNPLSTINMNLQIMGRKPYLKPLDRERLDMAASEVSRLEGLLRQLLDLSKPLAPKMEPMDLNALVKECGKLLAPRLDKQGIRVRRFLARDLPPLVADRGMLEQALINLLLNAMDALGHGGRITLGSKLAPAGGQAAIQFWVQDSGPGLTPEEINAIFDPFVTKKPHGTGLGLTNVKRIAEAHGGVVEVQGNPGGGARFTLTIPVES